VRYVAEDEHERVGRMDGRDARRRGGIRLWASVKQKSDVQRERAGPVLQNNKALLAIRVYRVSKTRGIRRYDAKRAFVSRRFRRESSLFSLINPLDEMFLWMKYWTPRVRVYICEKRRIG